LKQLKKGRIAVEAGSQRQRVHEKADQIRDLSLGAIGDRRADHEIVLAAVALEQHPKRRQCSHKQGRAAALAQHNQRSNDRCRNHCGVGRAVAAAYRRTRPVGRQFQQRGSRVAFGAELLPPVAELRVVGRALKRAPLPVGVVGVLDRQGGQADSISAQIPGVVRAQLAVQHAERPVVRDQVMHRK
jgi:hypothetical protein